MPDIERQPKAGVCDLMGQQQRSGCVGDNAEACGGVGGLGLQGDAYAGGAGGQQLLVGINRVLPGSVVIDLPECAVRYGGQEGY